jgi:SAM-dependent methyltransferase
MKVAPDWHKSFFVDSFYNPASAAALKNAPSEARFIAGRLRLRRGAALLDLCCGPGRHAVELAARGFAVTGYDFSSNYLRQAALRAGKRKTRLRLVRGDMRRLKFREEFDAAINLFTSFGYFKKKSDDEAVLRGVARSLKTGGLFMLDIVNGDFLKNNFRPRHWEKLEDGSFLLEENLLEAAGTNCAWTLVRRGKKPARRTFFLRLYNKATLSAALKKVGLRPLRFWGGFNGAPLSKKSARLIALAEKLEARPPRH